MKVRSLSVALVALTLLGATLGCGGDGRPSGLPPPGIMPAPATCGTVLPCGGDVTGTWKVLGGCLGPSYGETPPCPGGNIKLLTLDYSGTVTFNPDLTYTSNDLAVTRAEIDTLPTSCLPTKTCADQDKELKMSVGPSQFLSYASCTGTSTCSCTIAQTNATLSPASGTYSLGVDQIVFPGSSGGWPYCVQDGLLHLLLIEAFVDSSGAQTTQINEDIVAQLQ
jgi:hypothetical protein